LILVLFLMSSSDPMDLPTVNNSAFQVGEKLRYRITYGFVDAGEATLEVKSTSKTGNGRELFHAVGIGRTLGGFNAFYKVDDRYESYLDKKGVFPWFFCASRRRRWLQNQSRLCVQTPPSKSG